MKQLARIGLLWFLTDFNFAEISKEGKDRERLFLAFLFRLLFGGGGCTNRSSLSSLSLNAAVCVPGQAVGGHRPQHSFFVHSIFTPTCEQFPFHLWSPVALFNLGALTQYFIKIMQMAAP